MRWLTMDLFLIWGCLWRSNHVEVSWMVGKNICCHGVGWRRNSCRCGGNTLPFHWYPNSWLETREYRTNEKQTNHLSIPPPTFLPTMSFVSPSFGQPPIRSERMDWSIHAYLPRDVKAVFKGRNPVLPAPATSWDNRRVWYESKSEEQLLILM